MYCTEHCTLEHCKVYTELWIEYAHKPLRSALLMQRFVSQNVFRETGESCLRERFNVALRSAFLTLCNDYASKKRFFVTVSCATKTFLFKICIHINRFVALCLCNGLFHISLSARLLKNSFVEVRSAIL